MDKSQPVFTCNKTKSKVNVQRRVNKGFDMPILKKFLKHCHLLRVLDFTVILVNIRAQFFALVFWICLYYKTFTSLIDTGAYGEFSKTCKMEIFLSH